MLRILVLVMCGVWSLISFAAERESPTVVRFAAGTVTPWVYKGESGSEQGLLIEFSRSLASYTGIAYTNILQPYPRALQSLKSGYVDFAVAFESPSVAKTAILVGGVSRSQVLMVARQGEASQYQPPLRGGLRLGYIRGSDYDLTRRDRKSLNLFPVNNMEQGLEMLLKKRIDIMVGTEDAFEWALRDMQLGAEQLELVRVLGETRVGLYMSRQSSNQGLLKVYQQALQDMKKDGELERIFESRHQWVIDALTSKPAQEFIKSRQEIRSKRAL
ncbi:transporter substrate-binding domain-containing protein [Aestuariicella sp. G3-2]|uniref:substrate-binding periplasmic protein n=1 Tax=Pseudomaricurvus albidus TaxID=2842452 RepID=UPI001C0C6A22|nr:transporter substrate-binding domain-containing protein [Aestuariicella albida]MBU3069567.1 transporter substrate-binding domain-containing protein [Aestuariicella albida]